MADVKITTRGNQVIDLHIQDIDFTQLTKSAFKGVDAVELTLNVDVNTMWQAFAHVDDHTGLIIQDTANNISKYWSYLVEQPSRIKEIIIL